MRNYERIVENTFLPAQRYAHQKRKDFRNAAICVRMGIMQTENLLAKTRYKKLKVRKRFWDIIEKRIKEEKQCLITYKFKCQEQCEKALEELREVYCTTSPTRHFRHIFTEFDYLMSNMDRKEVMKVQFHPNFLLDQVIKEMEKMNISLGKTKANNNKSVEMKQNEPFEHDLMGNEAVSLHQNYKEKERGQQKCHTTTNNHEKTDLITNAEINFDQDCIEEKLEILHEDSSNDEDSTLHKDYLTKTVHQQEHDYQVSKDEENDLLSEDTESTPLIKHDNLKEQVAHKKNTAVKAKEEKKVLIKEKKKAKKKKTYENDPIVEFEDVVVEDLPSTRNVSEVLKYMIKNDQKPTIPSFVRNIPLESIQSTIDDNEDWEFVSQFYVPNPGTVLYSDIIGYQQEKDNFIAWSKQVMEIFDENSWNYLRNQTDIPMACLLHGASGCGKTQFALFFIIC